MRPAALSHNNSVNADAPHTTCAPRPLRFRLGLQTNPVLRKSERCLHGIREDV